MCRLLGNHAGNVFAGQLLGMNRQRHLLGLVSGIEAVDQVLQRNQQAAGGAVRFKAVIAVNHRNEPHAHGREDVLQQVDRKGKDRFQSHSNQYNLNQYYFLVIFGVPFSQ